MKSKPARKRDAVEAPVELEGLREDLGKKDQELEALRAQVAQLDAARFQAQQASMALQQAHGALRDRDQHLAHLQKELSETQARLVSEHEQMELLTVQLESARRIAGKAPSLESALQEEREALASARAERSAQFFMRALTGSLTPSTLSLSTLTSLSPTCWTART